MAGWWACFAVHAVMIAIDTVIPALENMSSFLLPNLCIVLRPQSAAAAIIGVWIALRRSWVFTLVMPTVLTIFRVSSDLIISKKIVKHTHQREVVASRRQVQLTKPGDASYEEGSVSCFAGVEELSEIPPSLIGSINFNNFLHLLQLEVCNQGIRVSVSMVLDEDRSRIFNTPLTDKPSWAFGNEPNCAKNNY